LLALREAGVEIGREISFVGCDAPAIAELHQPLIATVRRDMVAAGTAAADLLLEELRSSHRVAQQERVLPTEFHARPSCSTVSE